jgi:hypothetical protein
MVRDHDGPAAVREEAKMHPYISQAIMNERVSDLRRQAAASRLARQARQTRLAGRPALHGHSRSRTVTGGAAAGRPRAAS